MHIPPPSTHTIQSTHQVPVDLEAGNSPSHNPLGNDVSDGTTGKVLSDSNTSSVDPASTSLKNDLIAGMVANLIAQLATIFDSSNQTHTQEIQQATSHKEDLKLALQKMLTTQLDQVAQLPANIRVAFIDEIKNQVSQEVGPQLGSLTESNTGSSSSSDAANQIINTEAFKKVCSIVEAVIAATMKSNPAVQ